MFLAKPDFVSTLKNFLNRKLPMNVFVEEKIFKFDEDEDQNQYSIDNIKIEKCPIKLIKKYIQIENKQIENKYKLNKIDEPKIKIHGFIIK